MAHQPPMRFPFIGPPGAIPGTFLGKGWAAMIPNRVAGADTTREPAEEPLIGN